MFSVKHYFIYQDTFEIIYFMNYAISNMLLTSLYNLFTVLVDYVHMLYLLYLQCVTSICQ